MNRGYIFEVDRLSDITSGANLQATCQGPMPGLGGNGDISRTPARLESDSEWPYPRSQLDCQTRSWTVCMFLASQCCNAHSIDIRSTSTYSSSSSRGQGAGSPEMKSGCGARVPLSLCNGYYSSVSPFDLPFTHSARASSSIQ